jgi:5-methylcytosine-specific restriction endonuclease McrA
MTAAVTVWNASYEPISHTRLQRAMALVVAGRAVIEEALPDKFIRHKNGQFPWPKIIRLLKYVKVPIKYGEETWSRQGVLRRDNHKCIFCGKHATTIEHLMPTSRGGGPRDWLNTAAACQPCNNKKGDRTVKEAHMKLLFQPYAPKKIHLSVY